MSLYFDGAFACYLKPDVPQQVLDTLQYMTRTENYAFDKPPGHKFFQNDDWRNFLKISQEWTCAPGFVGSDFRKTHQYTTEDGNDVYWYSLSFRRTMHDDVEFYVLWWDFLNWIAPYSLTSGYVGYCREQYTINPTLIYFKRGRGIVYLYDVQGIPKGLNGESWSD